MLDVPPNFRCRLKFPVMGFDVSGNVTVEDREVRLDGQIPITALAFKGKIESVMRDKMTELLKD